MWYWFCRSGTFHSNVRLVSEDAARLSPDSVAGTTHTHTEANVVLHCVTLCDIVTFDYFVLCRLSPSLLVVTLTLSEAGSDWLREETPFDDWTVKVYLV